MINIVLTFFLLPTVYAIDNTYLLNKMSLLERKIENQNDLVQHDLQALFLEISKYDALLKKACSEIKGNCTAYSKQLTSLEAHGEQQNSDDSNIMNIYFRAFKAEKQARSTQFRRLQDHLNVVQNLVLTANESFSSKLSNTLNRVEANSDRLRKFEQEHNREIVSLKQYIEEVNGNVGNNLTLIKETLSELTRPASCRKIGQNSKQSGIYRIFPPSFGNGTDVYCDQDTDGGGWIVFQRRMDGSEDFYRGWEDYKKGFGDLEKEFWLGNEYIHHLTKDGTHEMRIDMTYKTEKAYVEYEHFLIGPETDNYRLTISNGHGTAGDSLVENNGAQFTTKDRDNDKFGLNCANKYIYHGAWWYPDACGYSNLNAKYGGAVVEGKLLWYSWKNSFAPSINAVEMKIR